MFESVNYTNMMPNLLSSVLHNISLNTLFKTNNKLLNTLYKAGKDKYNYNKYKYKDKYCLEKFILISVLQSNKLIFILSKH